MVTFVKFLLLFSHGNLYTNLLSFEYNVPSIFSFSSIHLDSTPYPIFNINLVAELPLFITSILLATLYKNDEWTEFS